MCEIVKAYRIINQDSKLLGYSGLIQGSRAEPYNADLFRMEFLNSHEKYTVLISYCDCKDWHFRRRKAKSFCKHQEFLLSSAAQITKEFISTPILIEE